MDGFDRAAGGMGARVAVPSVGVRSPVRHVEAPVSSLSGNGIGAQSRQMLASPNKAIMEAPAPTREPPFERERTFAVLRSAHARPATSPPCPGVTSSRDRRNARSPSSETGRGLLLRRRAGAKLSLRRSDWHVVSQKGDGPQRLSLRDWTERREMFITRHRWSLMRVGLVAVAIVGGGQGAAGL